MTEIGQELTACRHRSIRWSNCRPVSGVNAGTADATRYGMEALVTIRRTLLNGEPGHAVSCLVGKSLDGGWDISVEVDQRIVFARHCTEWHRVERLCSRITDQSWDGNTHDLHD